jgi:hypothetical protein
MPTWGCLSLWDDARFSQGLGQALNSPERRYFGIHSRVRRGSAEPFTNAAEMPGVLLSGAGVLRCCAWSAVRAEDGHFDATVLLPVVSCLLIIHGLVFAEPDDLDAVDRYIVLRHKVRLYGLGTATAELEIVFGSSRLIREAFDGHEVALHASDFGATELVELLLGIVGQLRGIKLEQDGDVARGLVIVNVRNALIQLAVELVGEVGFDLVGFLGGGVRTPEGVASARIRGIRFFGGRADLGLGTLQLFLGILRLLLHIVDLRGDGICLLGDVLLRRAASQQEHHAGHDR